MSGRIGDPSESGINQIYFVNQSVISRYYLLADIDVQISGIFIMKDDLIEWDVDCKQSGHTCLALPLFWFIVLVVTKISDNKFK